MLTEKETTRYSKFLSLVLRHQPELIGITLDEQGWTNVATLLTKAQAHGQKLSFEQLAYIIETSPKQRFSFNDDHTRIRASQGHSVDVELGYTPVAPPEVLYHGTATRHQEAILHGVLLKMNRHHVHLSADTDTAHTVGARHGRPVIFQVDAARMHRDGYLFYQSANGVWLTEAVPAAYLELLPEQGR